MDWPCRDTGYLGSLGVGFGQSVVSGKEKPKLQAIVASEEQGSLGES